MQVESIAERSQGAFWNTFDLYYVWKNKQLFAFLSGLLRQVYINN